MPAPLHSPFAILESFVAFGLALILHNCAQVLTASLLGDRTAINKGRLSLLPRAHLSALGVITAIVTSFSAACGLGWGKPVEADATELRPGPNLGTILVALSGLLTNLLVGLGIAFALSFMPGLAHVRALLPTCLGVNAVGAAMQGCLHSAQPGYLLYIEQFVIVFAVANVGLALFNLIPLHPLDGYHILFALLPTRPAIAYRNFIPYMELVLLTILFVIPYILGFLRIPFNPAGYIADLARWLVYSFGDPAYIFYLAL